MKTGIELITEERLEQIQKHGWSLENDQFYNNKELIKSALSCIAQDKDLDNVFYFSASRLWPHNWIKDPYYFNIAHRKNRIQQLTVAAALIAAEIDRLLILEAVNQ